MKPICFKGTLSSMLNSGENEYEKGMKKKLFEVSASGFIRDASRVRPFIVFDLGALRDRSGCSCNHNFMTLLEQVLYTFARLFLYM